MTASKRPSKQDQTKAAEQALLGESLRLTNNYEQALLEFNVAIELDGNNSWVLARRGETYRLLQKYHEALADFDRAIQLDENNDWAFASRGLAHRLLDEYEKALADYDRAIALNPVNAWAYAFRGDAYRRLKKNELALADLSYAIFLDDEYAGAYLYRGVTYFDMAVYTKALDDFDRAINLHKKNATTVINRGKSWHHLEKFEKALNDVNRQVLFVYRGISYRVLNQFEKALLDLNLAIELKGDDSWALANRGFTYFKLDKYQQALADFDKAIALNENYGWALAERGETCRMLGKNEQAIADLTRAIELNQKEAWIFASRGSARRNLGKYTEALTDFNQSLLDNNNYAWGLAGRGATYNLMGKYSEALADLDRAIELNGKDTWAIGQRDLVRGKLEKVNGEKLEKARKDFELGNFLKALELPIHASPSEIIIRIADQMEEYQSAEYQSMKDKAPLLKELVRNLNLAQEALTNRKEEYQAACRLRDRSFELITTKYGPVSLDILKTDLWKRIWTMGYALSSAPQMNSDVILAEAERFIGGFQALEITRDEVESRQASRSIIDQHNENCPRCGGKRRLKLRGWEVVDEAKTNRKLWKEMLENDIPIDALSRQRQNGSQQKPPGLSIEIPCPACITEVIFTVPADVKKGWVIQSRSKAGVTPHYIRVSAIAPAVKRKTWTQRPAPFFLDIWIKLGALVSMLLYYVLNPLGIFLNRWYVKEPPDKTKKLGFRGLCYLICFIILGLMIWDLSSHSADVRIWWQPASGFSIARFLNDMPLPIQRAALGLIPVISLFVFGRAPIQRGDS